MAGLFVLAAAAGAALQLALWARQLRTRNAATIDVGWTALVALGAAVAAVESPGDPARRLVVAGLAAIWALRLGAHLVRDRARGSVAEDGRYRALRQRWAGAASRNFLVLYLAQVPVAALFVVPLAAAMRGGPPDAWTAAGVAIGLVAVAGEWVADRQLARFRADPRNRGDVCREGLWRSSRHPNYFFEWLYWWAYVAVGHAHPLTFLGPAAMLLFLFRVTGIPHTERESLRTRGDAYRAYQRTTSAFFPWPPAESFRLRRRQVVGGTLEEVFGFFKSPRNLEAITPESLGFRILASTDEEVRDGTLISYRLRLHGIPVRWESRIAEYVENEKFADEQVRGPYAYWYHRHLFRAVPEGVEIEDDVEYRMPFGPVGRIARAVFVRGELERIFDHRARVTSSRFPVSAAPRGKEGPE